RESCGKRCRVGTAGHRRRKRWTHSSRRGAAGGAAGIAVTTTATSATADPAAARRAAAQYGRAPEGARKLVPEEAGCRNAEGTSPPDRCERATGELWHILQPRGAPHGCVAGRDPWCEQ